MACSDTLDALASYCCRYYCIWLRSSLLWLAFALRPKFSSDSCQFIDLDDLSVFCPLVIWNISQAFAYLNWITCECWWVSNLSIQLMKFHVVMGYTMFLLYASLTRRRRGHKVIWTATVRDTDFFSWKSNGAVANLLPMSITITKFWPWRLVRLPALGQNTNHIFV